MKEIKRLAEITPNWISGGGIFAELEKMNVPWRGLTVNLGLDIQYYGNHSGKKIISPLVEAILSGDTLSSGDITILATTATTIYGENWNELWKTLNYEYNPIENYSMIEETILDKTTYDHGKITTRTDDLKHHSEGNGTNNPNTKDTRTDDLIHAKTGVDTFTPNIKETQSPDLKTNNDRNIFAFNSPSAVPYNNDVSIQTGTQVSFRSGTEETEYGSTEKNTGTQTYTHTGEDKTEYKSDENNTGTQKFVDSGVDTQNREYKFKRSGNIGITTSQQMVQSQRDLWMWNFFKDIVFKDLDEILTIQIY